MDTFLLKVEAEDRLLLALDPENYEKENIKTAFIVTISFMTPVLIPEPRLYWDIDVEKKDAWLNIDAVFNPSSIRFMIHGLLGWAQHEASWFDKFQLAQSQLFLDSDPSCVGLIAFYLKLLQNWSQDVNCGSQ